MVCSDQRKRWYRGTWYLERGSGMEYRPRKVMRSVLTRKAALVAALGLIGGLPVGYALAQGADSGDTVAPDPAYEEVPFSPPDSASALPPGVSLRPELSELQSKQASQNDLNDQ